MKHTEETEQALVIRWSHTQAARAVIPALRWLWHPANGGLRSKLAGAQMTALGVKKGQPDLLLPYRQGPFTGLVIEMKAAGEPGKPKGRVSPEQREWLDHYDSQGWSVSVAYSAIEAHAAICAYFSIAPATLPLAP